MRFQLVANVLHLLSGLIPENDQLDWIYGLIEDWADYHDLAFHDQLRAAMRDETYRALE